MKSIAKILLCLLLVASLMLGLCACKKNLAGTYILSRIVFEDGTVLEGEELEYEMEYVFDMKLSDTYLKLNEDGTGTICIYGFEQEIGYDESSIWYMMDMELGMYLDDYYPMEFDEDGVPIEGDIPEETEPTVPEEIKKPFTLKGKTITLDPEDLGEMMTFTKVKK